MKTVRFSPEVRKLMERMDLPDRKFFQTFVGGESIGFNDEDFEVYYPEYPEVEALGRKPKPRNVH